MLPLCCTVAPRAECLTLIISIFLSDKNLPPGFPTILKNPSMKVVEKGRNAILECEAAGEPQVNIYWVKDTMRLQPNPRYNVMPTGKMRGETGATFCNGTGSALF